MEGGNGRGKSGKKSAKLIEEIPIKIKIEKT